MGAALKSDFVSLDVWIGSELPSSLASNDKSISVAMLPRFSLPVLLSLNNDVACVRAESGSRSAKKMDCQSPAESPLESKEMKKR